MPINNSIYKDAKCPKIVCYYSVAVIVVVVIFYSDLYNTALANSPSFHRQLVTDAAGDWNILQPSAPNCSKAGATSDLRAVTYISDGRFLNATFWLSGTFETHPKGLFRYPSYFMAIGIPSDNYPAGIDYLSSLRWDPINGYWVKTLEEYTPEDMRPLDRLSNYKVSFENVPEIRLGTLNGTAQQTGAKAHLDLSLDLHSLNFPDRYFVIFGLSDLGYGSNGFCQVIDTTDSASFIPQPKFTILTSEPILTMRPGENKTLELKINSTIPIKADMYFSNQSIPGLLVEYVPKNETLSPEALTISHLKIKVLDNAILDGDEQAPFSIPINGTIYFPKVSLFIGQEINRSLAGTQADIYQSVPAVPHYQSLVVLRPLTIQEKFSNFIDQWINPLSSLWTFLAGIGTVVIPLLIRKRIKS